MGEAQPNIFDPDFNRCVKVSTTDQRLTSHAGVVLVREFDHRLGLTESLAAQLVDPRRQDRVRYQAVELIRERLYALALGECHQDDLDRLAHDPAMKIACWDRPGEEVLAQRMASQPTQSRLIDWLSTIPSNREVLRHSLFDGLHRHLRSTGCQAVTGDLDRRVRQATIDIDSFPVEVHGKQQGASYNGYYRQTVYHPMVASFSVGGNYDGAHEGLRLGNGFLHCVLRQGNVHTAKGIRRFVRHVVEKAKQMAYTFDLRLDAGYTEGSVMDELTDQKVRFSGRLRKNPVLVQLAEPYLKRPVGRPPVDGYEYVVELGQHSAESWKHAQRLILVVVDKPDPKTGQLDLQPRYFFLITNWTETQRSATEVLTHYRQRGTFEDRLGEFNQAIGCRLSSHSFHENEVTILLGLLAFNLVSMMRNEFEYQVGGCWDLRRFQRTVLRAGARVIKKSRRLHLYIEQAVSNFWQTMAHCIARLRLPQRWTKPRGGRSRTYMPPPRHAHQQLVLRN